MSQTTTSFKPWVIVGLGTSATAVWLSSKHNRIRAKCWVRNFTRKVMPDPCYKTKVLPVEKGGHPNPYDHEDSKMVSEGSVYGVHYFNEKKQ
ncbi:MULTISPECIES: hypothetical protein [Fictibacillus]|uniref:Uncharacterized protein n=1 Tax=Fictibacillus terranigra TaxID=3058424 RepID=A0ABT8EAM2_9BACL|nr:hypothetical protein [Fictibacillus sp. CENA-BCM004]MDN4074966.1 hypothetical protein [Fictibacillus sp. CENA-BCM004]